MVIDTLPVTVKNLTDKFTITEVRGEKKKDQQTEYIVS